MENKKIPQFQNSIEHYRKRYKCNIDIQANSYYMMLTFPSA